MVTSAACECGTLEQTVDHVVIQCPIHQPPHQLHDLTVLDDETIEWLLNTCPKTTAWWLEELAEETKGFSTLSDLVLRQ